MGKKTKFKKLKRKKFKSNKSSNINQNNSNKEFSNNENNSNLNTFKPKKNKAFLHKRKSFKRKLKAIGKKNKNKNLFKVEHELLDEYYDLENLPHDKFNPFIVPNTPEENKKYLPSLISDSDIILELLDSRDIIHSRNKEVEEQIKNTKDKLLIFILTKSDLVSNEYLLKIKNYLQKEDSNSVIISISSLIRETINSLIIELKKYSDKLKLELKKEKVIKIIKIGIIGAPNVGKNSLIQSLELIFNANCEEKYISFGEDKTFCINSVPAIIFDENEENNYLISKKYKNLRDIKNPITLIKNLLNIVDKNILKEIYELNNAPEDLDEFLFMIKQKYQFEFDIMSVWKILEDIISGKIHYELDIN